MDPKNGRKVETTFLSHQSKSLTDCFYYKVVCPIKNNLLPTQYNLQSLHKTTIPSTLGFAVSEQLQRTMRMMNGYHRHGVHDRRPIVFDSMFSCVEACHDFVRQEADEFEKDVFGDTWGEEEDSIQEESGVEVLVQDQPRPFFSFLKKGTKWLDKLQPCGGDWEMDKIPRVIQTSTTTLMDLVEDENDG